jgi:glycosyltransferase involved in cell wall biosynthesis
VLNIGIRRKMSPLGDLQTLWRLIRLFRQERFDAVHSMTPKAGLLAMLAALIAGIPRRYHTFTGQIWANRSGIRRTFFKLIDRLIVRSASRVFADSASQCLFLKAEAVAPEQGVSVLGAGSVCGVDALRFRPDRTVRTAMRNALTVSEVNCVLLFVGRLASEKGVYDLLRAFAQLAAKHAQAVLWVVGPDEEGLSSSLKTLVDECADRVRWIGPTFEPEKYMASADFLVLPSYREGFGMVIVEAAACGIPSVAYRIDGVTDAVQDGETGVLVPKGNIDQLLLAMAQMLEDEAFRCELGSKAFLRVRRDFSDTAVTAVWMDFYERELGA